MVKCLASNLQSSQKRIMHCGPVPERGHARTGAHCCAMYVRSGAVPGGDPHSTQSRRNPSKFARAAAVVNPLLLPAVMPPSWGKSGEAGTARASPADSDLLGNTSVRAGRGAGAWLADGDITAVH